MVTRGVLVTGGLGGIGLAVARGFAHDGARLCLIDAHGDADGEAVTQLLADGAADAFVIEADVTDDAALADAVERLCAGGSFDVLVNVAGVMIYAALDALTGDQWRRMLDVNLVGAALLTGHALRRMGEGGAIINIASVHAQRTSPLVAPYAAAKAALVSLARSAAIEGKARGITANAILPGAIDTAMLRESPNIKSGAEVIDPADIGRPCDIAALALFLASEGARFINGEGIVADGGRMGRL